MAERTSLAWFIGANRERDLLDIGCNIPDETPLQTEDQLERISNNVSPSIDGKPSDVPLRDRFHGMPEEGTQTDVLWTVLVSERLLTALCIPHYRNRTFAEPAAVA